MAIEPSEGRRTRIWSSVASAGLGTALLLAFALPSLARINSTQPPSGHIEQGKSTSFVVILDGTGVTCVVATPSDLSIAVTVDVVSTCGNADRTVEIRVATSALTPIGEHTITIVELDALGGGVDERVWILTVVAEQTTSSTSTTTTATTTTTSTTATTAAPTTTGSPSSATSTTNPEETAVPAAPTTTRPAVPLSDSVTTTEPTTTTTESRTTTTTPSVGPGAGGQGGPGSGRPRSAGPEEGVIIPALSRTLRNTLGSVLPASVADIVVSPVLILEVVARAVLTSGWALIPTALAGVLAGWAVWKLVPAPRRTDDLRPGWQFLSTGDPL